MLEIVTVPAILLFTKKKADYENEECLKIKVFYLYFILKTEKKGYLSFNFHSPLWKPEKSAPFSHKKPDISRIFLRYKVNQLPWVIFISHQSQKKLERKISRVLSAFFCLLFSKSKKVDFLPFSLFGLLILTDSYQIKAGIPIFGPLDWQLSKITGNSEQWLVTLIYKCSYVDAHFVCRQCFKMSNVYVKIMDEKLKNSYSRGWMRFSLCNVVWGVDKGFIIES